MTTPTDEAMGALQHAYDHFNRTMFGGALPLVMLTLQRKSARVMGYFSPNRFTDGVARNTDELAMNPMHFLGQPAREALSTLAHEMVHVWQQHHGKPGRTRYHNKEWGQKMKDIGLHPSNTGAPGGKETGDQMSHYIVSGGLFEREAKRLEAAAFTWKWGEGNGVAVEPGPAGDDEPSKSKDKPKDKSNRIRFDYPGCKAKAWAKPSAKLMCGQCKLDLLPAK